MKDICLKLQRQAYGWEETFASRYLIKNLYSQYMKSAKINKKKNEATKMGITFQDIFIEIWWQIRYIKKLYIISHCENTNQTTIKFYYKYNDNQMRKQKPTKQKISSVENYVH